MQPSQDTSFNVVSFATSSWNKGVNSDGAMIRQTEGETIRLISVHTHNSCTYTKTDNPFKINNHNDRI